MIKCLAALALAVTTTFIAEHAAACSFAGLPPHEIDSTSGDDTPPAALAMPGVSVSRGHGPEGDGCGREATSCDDIGAIGIHIVPPADDRTAPANMGYAVELVAGKLPEGISILSPVRALDNTLWFHWIDGATDEQESIHFTLLIRAVDEAGNMSDGITVPVRHEGDGGGCRISTRQVSSSWLPSFVVTLLCLGFAHALAARLR